MADLELPRSSGRLHPASSCAPREKDTSPLPVRCVRPSDFTKSFKFVRTVYETVDGRGQRMPRFNLPPPSSPGKGNRVIPPRASSSSPSRLPATF